MILHETTSPLFSWKDFLQDTSNVQSMDIVRLKRESRKDGDTHVDLVERVSECEVAEHPRLVEVDELGHIVDAPKIGLRVPRQDLPTVYYSLPTPQISHKYNNQTGKPTQPRS